MQRFRCSCANSFIVLAFKYPWSLSIYGHMVGNLNFLNYLQLNAFLSDWHGVFTKNHRILHRKLIHLYKVFNVPFLNFITDAKLYVIYDVTIARKWDEIITNKHVIHPTTSLPSLKKIVTFYVCLWPKKLSFESCGSKSHSNRPSCLPVLLCFE